jgi:hypothetical protein
VTTYCKHGELRIWCREDGCRGQAVNLNYVRRIQCLPAVAARIADDLPELLGRLAQDQFTCEEEHGYTDIEVAKLIQHCEAVRAYAEELAAHYQR